MPVEGFVRFGATAFAMRAESNSSQLAAPDRVVSTPAAGLKRELRRVGYLLAATGETVPSILVYTETEWEIRGRTGSRFRRNVERDEVRVL